MTLVSIVLAACCKRPLDRSKRKDGQKGSANCKRTVSEQKEKVKKGRGRRYGVEKQDIRYA